MSKHEGHSHGDKDGCCGSEKEGCSTSTGGCCGCPCHKTLAILVMLFGLVFLLGEFGVLSQHMVRVICPVLVILGGLKAAMGRVCSCCK